MEQQVESELVYWAGEDADFPVTGWQYDVAAGDTRLGYWEWVEHNKESAVETL